MARGVGEAGGAEASLRGEGATPGRPLGAGLRRIGRLRRLRSAMDVQPRSENNIAYRAEFDRGGRFVAMEAPDPIVGDGRKFFRGPR
jgi:hypothetical protein